MLRPDGCFMGSPAPCSLPTSPHPPARPHSSPLAVLFPRGRAARLAISPLWFHTSRPGPAEVGFGGAAAFLAGFFFFCFLLPGWERRQMLSFKAAFDEREAEM